MAQHKVSKSNWPRKLAQVLRDAKSGDIIVLPDDDVLEVAVSTHKETYPDKRLSFLTFQNANDMHVLLVEEESEIERELQEWFSKMLDGLIRDVKQEELFGNVQALLREMFFHAGACTKLLLDSGTIRADSETLAALLHLAHDSLILGLVDGYGD